MITEEGIVLAVDKSGSAQVRTERPSACGSCKEKDSCHKMIGEPDCSQITVNSIGAVAGDRVLIGIETSSLVKLGMLIYIFPMIGMIAGAGLGLKVSPALGWESQMSSVIFSVIGFTLSFCMVKIFERQTDGTGRLRPKILKVIG